MTIVEIMSIAPVIPVIVLEDDSRAVPLAEALVAGGLPVVEVTLRTPAALESVRAIANAVPDAVVGVGTAVKPAQFAASAAAGARFAVSPGLTPNLAAAAQAAGLPYLPAAATASEVMAARNLGFRALKFFPAVPAGGAPVLKAFGEVFPEVVFCPAGGIRAETRDDFLGLVNVACVGGSWIASAAAIAEGDWDGITARARAASAPTRAVLT